MESGLLAHLPCLCLGNWCLVPGPGLGSVSLEEVVSLKALARTLVSAAWLAAKAAGEQVQESYCGGMRWSVPSRCMTVAIVLEGQGWRRTQGSLKEGLKRTNIQQTSRTLAMQWHGSINHMMHYAHSLIVTQYIGIESSFACHLLSSLPL